MWDTQLLNDIADALTNRQRVKRLPVRRIVGVLWRKLVHAGVEAGLLWIIKPVNHSRRVGVDGHANADRHPNRKNVRSVLRSGFDGLPSHRKAIPQLIRYRTAQAAAASQNPNFPAIIFRLLEGAVMLNVFVSEHFFDEKKEQRLFFLRHPLHVVVTADN